MKTFKPKLIMIDVDGTLVDSVPDLTYCVDEMMKQLGKEPCGEAKVRQWVGNGVPKLVERALTGELEATPNSEDYEKAYPVFLELYAENTAKRSCLYDGVREGLDYMKSQGYLLGCVTNKAEQFTLPLLKALGIFDDFSIIISGDTLAKKKP
ncbi:MAG TPA: HAD family hydrolase, partial [Candidatus Thioglobus sp.]|nr:HAD family hydrolase [Candidatus Thioglobus sp.]